MRRVWLRIHAFFLALMFAFVAVTPLTSIVAAEEAR